MNNDRWEKIYVRLLRLVVQTIAAVLGLYIMYKAINEGTDKPWLYAAALIMMGLPGARAFEQLISLAAEVLDALRSARKTQPPEPPEHPNDRRRNGR